MRGTRRRDCTVRTQTKWSCAAALGLLFRIKVPLFFLFHLSQEADLGVFFPPSPEEEILYYLAHGPFFRAFTADQAFPTPIRVTRGDPISSRCRVFGGEGRCRSNLNTMKEGRVDWRVDGWFVRFWLWIVSWLMLAEEVNFIIYQRKGKPVVDSWVHRWNIIAAPN